MGKSHVPVNSTVGACDSHTYTHSPTLAASKSSVTLFEQMGEGVQLQVLLYNSFILSVLFI